jgi:hypothetical protein
VRMSNTYSALRVSAGSGMMLPFEVGGEGLWWNELGELIHLADPPGTSGHVVSLRVLKLPFPGSVISGTGWERPPPNGRSSLTP